MNKLTVPAAALLIALSACQSSRKNVDTNKPLKLPAFNKEGHRGARGLMP